MILFPPAKINLGLNILKKRDDGYHDIETCMIPIPFTDVLEILPNSSFSFVQTGLEVKGDQNDNLVVKAYQLMREVYNIDTVYIHLQKNIPMGAGLGGGSADATYTLLGLNDLFNLGLSLHQLRELAGRLGSDCPFFVEDTAQIGRRRGEHLTPVELSLEGCYLKIVNPNIHISTAEAYAGAHIGTPDYFLEEVLSEAMISWKVRLKNGFESTMLPNHPLISEIKESLYLEGAIYASMTGSGSTVFGIFEQKPNITFPDLFEKVMKLN